MNGAAATVALQHLIRGRSEMVVSLVQEGNSHIYVSGLKGMEHGVDDAFGDACATQLAGYSKLYARAREAPY